MELFLIRHATAEPVALDGRDASRRLTDQGIDRFRRVVEALERLGVRLDRVFHSPLVRCVQTAELLAPVAAEIEPTDLLAQPPGDALFRCVAGERTAWVGHEPWMSETVSRLCGARDDFDVRMGKGSVAWLDGVPEPGGMRLIGLWTARMARRWISRP